MDLQEIIKQIPAKPYYQTELGVLYCGDCIELMKDIPETSIDMILCDLPYGTTACSWDIIIPFDKLWDLYLYITKKTTPIVLTASQPFTSKLIMSNPIVFKYCWVWDKVIQGNFLLAEYQPMKIHEDIAIFGKGKINYYPQMKKGKLRLTGGGKSKLWNMEMTKRLNDSYYPQSILTFSNANRGEHPTEKPVELFLYLIKTYTNENDLVLDNCIGSGTTAVACEKLNRRWIGIEISEKYCEIAKKRIMNEYNQIKMLI